VWVWGGVGVLARVWLAGGSRLFLPCFLPSLSILLSFLDYGCKIRKYTCQFLS
jgi:hypothetical protein